jgi:hypothetical protein
MEEGGKGEGEGEEPEGEEGGTPVRWRRPNLGRYSPRRRCERERLHRRRRWIHQAEGTPARGKREEEAARATATRILFDCRMRERAQRGASFILRFICLLLSGCEWGEGVAAVDAPEAADRTKAGMVEGGCILRSESISRVMKFDSKHTLATKRLPASRRSRKNSHSPCASIKTACKFSHRQVSDPHAHIPRRPLIGIPLKTAQKTMNERHGRTYFASSNGGTRQKTLYAEFMFWPLRLWKI